MTVRQQPVASSPPEAGRVSRTGFRPDIEGLRAVAVIAVVLYHAGVPGLPGGFVGVDVFLVVSGFLITGLLWREVSTTNAVELRRFFGARARRLLPAAAAVGVVTAVTAAAVLPPLQARGVLLDGIASALDVGNYRFALHGTDYLAPDRPLVWPVLMIGTAFLLGRLRRPGAAAGTAPYAVPLGLVAAASLAAAALCTRTSPPWTFFSLPTRAWELAAGGLVALSIRHWRRLPLLPAAVAGWGGLALPLVTCTQLGPRTPFPGTAALLPVLGTALVIGSGNVTKGLGVGRLLCRPAMQGVGRVSYSWYLWHWPVLLLLPPLLGLPAGLPGRLAAVVVSAGLAVLTLHLVENPGRFAAGLRRSARASLAVAVVDAFAQAREAVAAAANPRAVPENLDPSLAAAPADKPAAFVNGCVCSWREVGQDECASADTASATTVALVGDSQAARWQPAFQLLAEQRHWRLETMAEVTCPLQELRITSPYLGRRYTECEQWRGQVMSRLQAEHPRLVVLDMSRRYGADFGFTSYDPAWLDTLGRTVAQPRGTGATVLVLGPAADPRTSVPTCLSAHLDDATGCAPPRAVLTDLFCAPDRCPVVVGNTLVFRDDNHVTAEYARLLAPVMGALVDGAMAGN